MTPVAAVQVTQLAIKHAMAGQPGPVAVLFSHDFWPARSSRIPQPALYPTRYYLPPPPPPADAGASRPPRRRHARGQAAGDHRRQRRPHRAGLRALAALAEAAGLPVVTTAAGKGCFAETHRLALGVFGTFGTAAANACLGEADLVLALGTKLGPSDTAWANRDLLDPTRQSFIQVDIEPRNASWTFPAEHVVLGDAAHRLGSCARRSAAARGAAARPASARRGAAREAKGYFNAPAITPTTAPILPQRAIGELMRTLPDDAIVTCDAGENRIMMTHFYQTKQAGGFLQAAGSGPMGFAIPAALAAKLVHPDRPVVAVCGDGGFAMTMNGMMTAIEQDIPIITVVFNNNALGWVLHGGGPFAAEFNDFDHAAIARAMGCRGVRIDDPARARAGAAGGIAARQPTVIDVRTSLEQSFADITSPLAVEASPRRR